MNILITGANSFLGRALVRYYSEKGNNVYAITRKEVEFPDNVRNIVLEMSHYDEIVNYVDKCDVFINLAWAGTGHEGRNSQIIQQSNVAFSLSAIKAASMLGCKVFVESGSQAEYGDVTKSSIPTTEESECNPISEYGKAKLELKRKAFKLCDNLNITYLHLRIYSIIGEEDHPWTLVSTLIDKLIRNEDIELSECAQKWNFLYIEDAVEIITSLISYYLSQDKVSQEVFNIASNDTRQLKLFVEETKKIISSTSALKYGALNGAMPVSIWPCINKAESIIGKIEFISFDKIIKNIIKSKYDKNI